MIAWRARKRSFGGWGASVSGEFRTMCFFLHFSLDTSQRHPNHAMRSVLNPCGTQSERLTHKSALSFYQPATDKNGARGSDGFKRARWFHKELASKRRLKQLKTKLGKHAGPLFEGLRRIFGGVRLEWYDPSFHCCGCIRAPECEGGFGGGVSDRFPMGAMASRWTGQ